MNEHLKPGPAVVAGVEEIEEAVAACDSINSAIDRLIESETSAKAARDAAVSARAGLLTERALLTDPAAIRAFQPELDELLRTSTDAELELESMAIAREQLQRKLEDAEGHVRELREAGMHQQVRNLHAHAVGAEWYARVETVVRDHLLPLWLEGIALHAALPTHGLGEWLNESRIHALGTTNSPLLDRSEAIFDGQRTVLADAWQGVPELVAKYEAVKQVRDSVQPLEQYVPRKARAAQPPYGRRGYTIGAAVNRPSPDAEQAAADQEPQPTIEEALAMPGKWQTGGAARVHAPQEIGLAGRVLADPDFEQFR